MGRILALLILFAAALPAHAAPPIAAFGQLPTIGDIALSPDGTRFAAIVGSGDSAEVQVHNLARGAIIMRSPAGKYRLAVLQWAGPDYLILTVTQLRTLESDEFVFSGRGEFKQVLRYDFRRQTWGRLLENIPRVGNIVLKSPVIVDAGDKPALIAVGIAIPDDATVRAVLRVDIASGAVKVVERGTRETKDWVIAPDGTLLARSAYVQKTGLWTLAARRGDRWEEIYRETAPIDAPSLVGVGRTPGTVRMITHAKGEWQSGDINLSDGRFAGQPESLADYVTTDPTSGELLATLRVGHERPEYQFFNPDDQKLWQAIARAFQGAIVDWESWTPDRSKVAVSVFGGQYGNGIYVVDRVAKTAGLLGQRYAGIEPGDVAKVEAIRYRAADGTEIPAYLTLPAGRPARNLPLVVMPHDGPEARDELVFDWQAQAIASRGYAVLQPNYRGSYGYGEALLIAGRGEWGRKMQSDVSDGVHHLAAQGIIDAKRVCVVGSGYGGYVAMAGVTLEQGVYRCASSFGGISDLRLLLRRWIGSDRRETSDARWLQRLIGSSNPDDPGVAAISPARQAARLSAPLQLIHGSDDVKVPIEQSRAMVDAAKAADKQVELISIPHLDHALSNAAARVAFLEALIAFLEKHNPPD